MKKRLLITSIVMMLVVAVALSTATYAWFTSNTSVSASTMTLKAAVSDQAALGIGWTGSAAGTSIVSDIYETLKPMAPEAKNGDSIVALANGQTYEYETGNLDFYNSSVKQVDGVFKFNNSTHINGEVRNGAQQEPVLYTETAANAKLTNESGHTSDVKSFYIKNLSSANTISSVKVKTVFPGVDQGTSYRVTTDATPVASKKTNNEYYVLVNSSFIQCTSTNDYAIGANFDPNFTYYEVAGPMVLTKDKKNTDEFVDTIYYELTQENNNVIYVPVDHSMIDEQTVGGVLKKKDGSTYTDLYEELSGNDMIRVALFTMEYRAVSIAATDYVAGTEENAGKKYAVEGVKYYDYNASTGVIALVHTGTQNDTTEVGDYYVRKSDNHTLLGVLGQSATKLTKTTTFDKNATYFTINPTAATGVTDWNFYEYFITNDSGNTYVKDTAYHSDKSYYSITQVKNVTSASYTAATTGQDSVPYYIAENTVANGEIKLNGDVKDLDYYTDVTTEITFAKDLKPGEQIDIIAVIWLDGTVLDDTRAAELAQVSLLFETNDVAND